MLPYVRPLVHSLLEHGRMDEHHHPLHPSAWLLPLLVINNTTAAPLPPVSPLSTPLSATHWDITIW